MDYKYIEQLLERYFNCETTLSEEEILRTFFSQKDVPIGLLKYKDLFCYEYQNKKLETLSEDFDKRLTAIIEEPKPIKAHRMTIPQRLMPLFKAAAIVAIFLTLQNAFQVAFKQDVSQDDTNSIQQTSSGKPVALGDSVKVDTLKNLPEEIPLLK